MEINDIGIDTGTGTLTPADGMADTDLYTYNSHFETTAMDVLSMYERVTGEKLDLTIDPESDPES